MENVSALEVSLNVGRNHKSCEIPIRSSHELEDDNIVCDAKEVVGETKVVEHPTRSSNEIENDVNKSMKKDRKGPNIFFVLETCENKETIKDDKHTESKENQDEVGPSNSNNLAKETNNIALYKRWKMKRKHPMIMMKMVMRRDLVKYWGYWKIQGRKFLNIEEVVIAEIHESNSDDEASEKVVEEEKQVKEESDTESHMEEDTKEVL